MNNMIEQDNVLKAGINFTNELGKDQKKWRERFGTIDLEQWRLEQLCHNKVDWVYVGDWQADQTKPYQGYLERKDNLLNDVYHYWPSNNQKS